MSLVTIYAPNGEPFEVAPAKVGDLVLNKGFTQTRVDPNAEPAVKSVDLGRGSERRDARPFDRYWR